MSGSAGLSAAKRRRAEQQLPPPQQTQTQARPNPSSSTASRPANRVLTPMSILEDHELRLRHIESCIKDVAVSEQPIENKVIGGASASSSTYNDSVKNELTAILTRISELENTNTELRKKVVVLESDLSSVSSKHSILQTFAMETNASLLKHKDAFEPGAVTKLMNILLDKTTINPKSVDDTVEVLCETTTTNTEEKEEAVKDDTVEKEKEKEQE